MRIREVVEKYHEALPGYNLVGYNELAVPVFERYLKILILEDKTIPVVEQFILNFYSLGLKEKEIQDIMGIKRELFEEAWFGLLQKDYIDNFTKKITSMGDGYLKENKVEKLTRESIKISIDGLTGKIEKSNQHLMSSKITRQKSLKVLKINNNNVNIENLNFQVVKNVYEEYKRNDEENYQGELLDIISLDGNTTKYRRVDILFFQNLDGDLRILAYDDYNKIEEYEEKILELEDEGQAILNSNIEEFLNDSNVKEIESYITSDENMLISLGNINNQWEKYFNCKDEYLIVTPLINECRIEKSFVNKITSLVQNDFKIKYYISGKEILNSFQKERCLELKSIKNDNFKLYSIPYFVNKMILNLTKKEGIVSVYEEMQINSNGSKNGIVEKAYKISKETFERIYQLINNIKINQSEPKLKNSNFDLQYLREKIFDISELVKGCNAKMQHIGWYGNGEIPDYDRLLKIPISKDKETFGVFIDSVNKSLVESLVNNSKANGYKNYFSNEFEKSYHELQGVLDKIRTYRNKSNHFKLNEFNRKKYLEYLGEDLNGYMPELINDGFLILQELILLELDSSLRSTLTMLNEGRI
ncbi:hypothetical protein [Clostridium cibarium]|uniref:Swt1-like HEPN domain-containing protein n=1 Tax=Clostridium cibarium TaxID=2762247 RepID=A0ABR8PXZ5_9CLOT|nr:hypothetical protein [Clostridium cibarium]MBD7913046.1 hypothetical protein [Clostridium cibarium]